MPGCTYPSLPVVNLSSRAVEEPGTRLFRTPADPTRRSGPRWGSLTVCKAFAYGVNGPAHISHLVYYHHMCERVKDGSTMTAVYNGLHWAVQSGPFHTRTHAAYKLVGVWIFNDLHKAVKFRQLFKMRTPHIQALRDQLLTEGHIKQQVANHECH